MHAIYISAQSVKAVFLSTVVEIVSSFLLSRRKKLAVFKQLFVLSPRRSNKIIMMDGAAIDAHVRK